VLCLRSISGGPLPMKLLRKTSIQEHFGEFGQILRIDMPEGQGTVFVEYDDKRDAEDAQDTMNGKEFCGLPCTVVVAKDSSGEALNPQRMGNLPEKIMEMAQRYRLDDGASSKLIGAFSERGRLGCDVDRDIEELSDHLASSNKPSALVSMRLADFRAGKPIGPCKYVKKPAQGSFCDLVVKEAKELIASARTGTSGTREWRSSDDKDAAPGGGSDASSPAADADVCSTREHRQHRRTNGRGEQGEQDSAAREEGRNHGSAGRRRESADRERDRRDRPQTRRSRSRSRSGSRRSRRRDERSRC